MVIQCTNRRKAGGERVVFAYSSWRNVVLLMRKAWWQQSASTWGQEEIRSNLRSSAEAREVGGYPGFLRIMVKRRRKERGTQERKEGEGKCSLGKWKDFDITLWNQNINIIDKVIKHLSCEVLKLDRAISAEFSGCFSKHQNNYSINFKSLSTNLYILKCLNKIH